LGFMSGLNQNSCIDLVTFFQSLMKARLGLTSAVAVVVHG
jgi:hypothetical protein